MMSQEVYAQAPLVPERREIRILTLAPGTGDDVLHGDLTVDSLNYDDLHYTALSYTWSGPVSENVIIIGGLPLRITENLELALRRFRGPIRSKNMWVDAICINQSDNEEKSVQVSLMGDIYANATRTMVWLGEQSADSDVAMDFIRSLRPKGPKDPAKYSDEDSSDEDNSKKDSEDDSSDEDDSDEDNSNEDDSDEEGSHEDDDDKNGSHDAEDYSVEDDCDQDESDKDDSDEGDSEADDSHKAVSDADQIHLQAVTDLMRRKWWTRIWVVQEALKSRRVTVVCGAKELDMAYFAQLVKEEELEGNILTEEESEEPQLPVEQDFQGLTLEDISKKARHPPPKAFTGILSDWYVRKQQAETSGLPLMDLALLTRGFQASVQKDRIYALLGLATPDARSWIIPDYSDAMSHRLFLIRLSAYFLQFSSRPLRFASHCKASDCPSWVADWTAIDSKVIESIEHEDSSFYDMSEYGRSARSSERLPSSNHSTAVFNPRFEPPIKNLTRYQEPSALLVHGLLVDRVKTTFQIPHVHSITGKNSYTELPPFKAKLREWECAILEYVEMYHSEIGMIRKKPQWLTRATSKHVRKAALQSRDLKASVIKYLVCSKDSYNESLDPSNFYGQIRVLHEDFEDDATRLISDYESWMQQPGQDACEFCKDILHGYTNPCAYCSASKTSIRIERLGQDIIKWNAGRTMFLTEDGYHYVEKFAVAEGDVICKPWHSFYHLILRRTEDEHWTLVGHFKPEDSSLQGTKRVDRSNAEAKTEIFRLK